MKLNCYIVRDLLANYIDGLTSEYTNKDIENHLEECKECNQVYKNMSVPVDEIKAEDKEMLSENKKKVSYLKKCSNAVIIAVAAACIFAVIIAALIIGIIVLWNMDSKEVVKDISKYEYVLGKDGKYKQNYIGYNDIFPDKIPDSAVVENFYYEYYNPWDANYLGYLVYTCDAEDYEEEYMRLKNINSSDNYFVYGSEEFPYELCAVYADSYSGYIYALADVKNSRFIYVELEFCNFFTDIDYEKIIDKEYLPKGFNAYIDNEVRQAFEEGGDLSE